MQIGKATAYVIERNQKTALTMDVNEFFHHPGITNPGFIDFYDDIVRIKLTAPDHIYQMVRADGLIQYRRTQVEKQERLFYA
jgi:hypothetical protein